MTPRAEVIARMQQATMLDRMLTLAELGNAAAFLASHRAGAMTATLANIALRRLPRLAAGEASLERSRTPVERPTVNNPQP